MPNEAETSSEVDLRDYLRVLQRRKGLILLLAFTMGVAAFGASSLQTKVYAAHAKVLLQPRSTDTLFNPQTGGYNDPARRVQTEIEVLSSEPVEAAVSEQLGSVPSISANALGVTDVIELTAESPDPKRAAAVVNAYAKAYVEFRRKQAVGDLVAASEEIQKKVSDLQSQIDEFDRGAAEGSASAQAVARDSAAPRKEALLDQQNLFRQRINQLQVDANLTTGLAQLVSLGSVPDAPVSPKPVRNSVLGLLAGLVLGIGLAFLLEHLDDSVKTKEALERASGGVPVVGMIPLVTGWKTKDEPRVVSLVDSRSAATEAYRTLRTSIQFLALERPLRMLQITSPTAEEGKTTTVANLAVALSGAGQRVVIACCDLRRPRIHEFFGLTNTVGLTSVLLGEAPLSAAIQKVPGQARLSVLASGPIPPNPSELLASPRTAEVLASLHAHADIVVLDSTPVLPVTDSLILSGRVDATLLTCYAGGTTRKQVARAVELLRQVDAPLLGAVLNGVSVGDAYGYAYSYYYKQDRDQEAGGGGNGRRGWIRRPKGDQSSEAKASAKT